MSRSVRALVAALVVALPCPAAPPDGKVEERAAAHHNRGLAHLAEEQPEKAIEAFRATLAAQSPPRPESRYNLALAWFRARRFDEALDILEPLGEGLPEARVLRARILRTAGRTEEALAVWTDAWKDGDLDPSTLWHLGQLFQLASRFDDAADVYAELGRAGGPAASAAAIEAAEALAFGGELEAAWDQLQKAARLGRDEEEVQSILEEIRQTMEGQDLDETQVLMSVAVNLLRATEAYRAAVDSLTASKAHSLLSDASLPLPVSPEPGPSPPPFQKVATHSASSGAVALCEVEGHLIVVGPEGGQRLAPGPEGFEPMGAVPGGLECASADLDHDGKPELVLAGSEATRILWSGDADPPVSTLAGAARGFALLDHDLDGDTDVVTHDSAAVRIWRNHRDRTFSDATSEAGLGEAIPDISVLGVVPIDLDTDGDFELAVAGTSAGYLLEGLQNEAVVRRPTPLPAGPLAAADLNRDGVPDLVAAGEILLRGSDEKPTVVRASELRNAARLGTADLDADGFTDLLTLDADGRLRVLRGLEDHELAAWGDVSVSRVRDLVVADLTGNGRLDLALLRDDTVELYTGPSLGHTLAVTLRGTKDNPDALGSRMELWAGELRLAQQIRTATHELGQQGRHRVLGLGRRDGGQWLRVTWPNETWASVEDFSPGAVSIEQDPSLVGSCPFLYSWDGTQFAFVTDLLGGAPLALPVSREANMPSDPEEYVLLDSGQLRPRNGRYELRVTVELREILYLDRTALLVVDHPEGSVIATDDGLQPPPFPPFHLYAGRQARPPVAAVDHVGNDMRELLEQIDGRYPDTLEPSVYQGYASPHALTLTFTPPESRENPFLVLRGGYYWSEADNLALSQSRTVVPRPPLLEIWRNGRWESLVDPMPFPGGRAKTLAVDLGESLPEGPVKLRISSNLRLVFDQILLATENVPAEGIRVHRPPLATAELRWRGYSEQGPFDGHLPPPFVYDIRKVGKPYPRIEGFFTRYGDVLPLLTQADDASVILHHGDEVALSFPALPPPAPGFERSFLFYSVGWDKDGDPSVETGTRVEPLPFRAMESYPYAPPEAFPWTPELRRLDRHYRTRWISGSR